MIVEEADAPRLQSLARQKLQDLRLLPFAPNGPGDGPPELEDEPLGFRGFLLGVDGQEITVLPEGQKSGLVGRALADSGVLPVEIMGEDAEGVLGGAHVEGVHDEIGLAVLVEAPGHEELHVIGAIDLARAVDVVEDRGRVEDLVGLREPWPGRGRDGRGEEPGFGNDRLAHRGGSSGTGQNGGQNDNLPHSGRLYHARPGVTRKRTGGARRLQK